MKKTLGALALAAVVAATGCSAQPATPTAPSPAAAQADLLASHGLAGLTGPEVVERLDRDPAKRPLALRASVRADRVTLSDGTRDSSLPIPADKGFYLSVAPYASRTHDCYFHNLGTCQGELADTPVHVRITDSTGRVLVDEATSTYGNGFVGHWLPRDITGTVEITVAGKTGSAPFATGTDDATCLTTLRVSQAATG